MLLLECRLPPESGIVGSTAAKQLPHYQPFVQLAGASKSPRLFRISQSPFAKAGLALRIFSATDPVGSSLLAC